MASKLSMTFDEYINNPSGPGSAINSSRQSTDSFYRSKFNNLVETEEIKYTCYREGNSSYLIHFLIPSESVKGFYHDVVVQFIEPNTEGISKGDIKNYKTLYFSNDPGFIFTYAHAFKTHNLLIPQLERKINLQSILMKASTRNPDNVVGYVKSFYFAYLCMQKYNLFDKSVLDRKCLGSKNGMNMLIHAIPPYYQKEHDRKKIAEENKKGRTEKIHSDTANNKYNLTGGHDIFTKFVKKVGSVGFAKKSRHVGTVKKSKKI